MTWDYGECYNERRQRERFENMILTCVWQINMMALTGEAGRCVLPGLCILAVLLSAAAYEIHYRTVRIYNWNGRRYCYLGRAGLRTGGDGYLVCLGERMADLSYTTLYQLCPAKRFVNRNRYKDMILCAGREQRVLHVDDCMRQSVYYRR